MVLSSSQIVSRHPAAHHGTEMTHDMSCDTRHMPHDTTWNCFGSFLEVFPNFWKNFQKFGRFSRQKHTAPTFRQEVQETTK